MEEELEKIKVSLKKLNEEKELRDISEEEYNEKVCEYFCNAAESSSLSSLLFLSSLLPSQLFLNYRSTKTGEKGWNAILYASKGASIEVMEFLLSFGFDINSLSTYKENCLFIAIKNGKSKEYIEYLFSKAANFSQTNEDDDNLCAILLRGGKYNDDDKDVLEILKYLVEERGVDIHYKPKYGESAIQLATSHNVEIMKYLVSLHSDINIQLCGGEGVIHLAIKANNMEVIEYLISLNINLDWITYEGYTLFLYAVKYSNLKVIQYLVSLNQFDIHYQISPGFFYYKCNAIIIAAERNDIEIIQYLVSLDIDFQCTDQDGNNSLFFLLYPTNEQTDFDCDKILNTMKYFISIGINYYQENNLYKDIVKYTLKTANLELIKFIYSLYNPFVYFDKNLNLTTYLSSRNPFEVDIFRFIIENNIANENSLGKVNLILHQLVQNLNIFSNDQKTNFNSQITFTTLTSIEKFTKFKECFEYFINRGNNINTFDNNNRIPIQYLSPLINFNLFWKVIKYLINRGSDLLHQSKLGSLLHILLSYKMLGKVDGKMISDIAKYVVVRSLDLNEKSNPQRSIIHLCKFQIYYGHSMMREIWKSSFYSFVLTPFIFTIPDQNNRFIKLDQLQNKTDILN